MEKTIIITGLVVILAIYIMLMIVVSYLRLIIRKLDRMRDCMLKPGDEGRCNEGDILTRERIHSLLEQLNRVKKQCTELQAENLKLHSDLNLARIEILDKNRNLESEIRDKNRNLNEKKRRT